MEENLQHGVISKGKFLRKLRRASRPKFHNSTLGMASVPYDWTKEIPIIIETRKNQEASSECGGMAGSYFLINLNKLTSNIETDISEKSIYAPIAYPGGGTTVYALENQIANAGANLQTDVPSKRPDGIVDEAWVSDTSWITPELKQKALYNAGKLSQTVNIDIDSIAEAIRDTGGVIIEVEGKNGETPSWVTSIPTPPRKNNPNPIWRHFIFGGGTKLINGVKHIAFVNSWGMAVGEGGLQYLSEDYINSGHVIDVFTFLPKSISTGGIINTDSWLYSFYQKVLHYFFT